MTRVEQLADEIDDELDRFGGAGLRNRRAHLERLHVAVETRHLRFGQLEVRHAELTRLRKDRVVDVGDVAHVAHGVTELFEPTDENVVGQVRGRVSEVGRVVRRDATHVHAHRGRRIEGNNRPPRSVVQTQTHERTLVCAFCYLGHEMP